MKKMKCFIYVTIFASLICFSGCGKNNEKAGSGTQPEGQASEDSGAINEGTVQMANPWRESSEAEIEKILDTDVRLPENSSDIEYRVMNDGEICETDFCYDDLSFTYRLKAAEKAEDISGLYYEWDVTDDVDFHGCKAFAKRSVSDEETVDLFQWYDEEKGIIHSLSTAAADLDGFDIQGIAELLYIDDNN